MIAGVINPTSSFQTEGRMYTHVSTYVGFLNRTAWFAEQYGEKQRVRSLIEYEKEGLQVVEFLVPSNFIKSGF
jgi:hypothetical protein